MLWFAGVHSRRFHRAAIAFRYDRHFPGVHNESPAQAILLAPLLVRREIHTDQFRTSLGFEVLETLPTTYFLPTDVTVRVEEELDHTYRIDMQADVKLQVIACILTFAFQRPFDTPEDHHDTFMDQDALRSWDVYERGRIPFAMRRPANTQSKYFLGDQAQEKAVEAAEKLTKYLIDSLDDQTYMSVLRALRLYQLALLIRYTDFDLAYALLVASAEAMATLAIQRTEAELEPEELHVYEWSKSQDPSIQKWAKNKILDQALLGERFTQYILRYAPLNRWDEIRHPKQSQDEQMTEQMEEFNARTGMTQDYSWALGYRRSHREAFPNELTDAQVRRIVKQTYHKQRSPYFHTGTPASLSESDAPWYFETLEYQGKVNADGTIQYRREHVMTFDALAAVIRMAGLAYLDDVCA